MIKVGKEDNLRQERLEYHMGGSERHCDKRWNRSGVWTKVIFLCHHYICVENIVGKNKTTESSQEGNMKIHKRG